MLKNESFRIHVKFCISNKKSVRNSLEIFSKVQILTKSSCGVEISEKRAIPDYVLLRPSYVLLRPSYVLLRPSYVLVTSYYVLFTSLLRPLTS